jgi:hypothetical protein
VPRVDVPGQERVVAPAVRQNQFRHPSAGQKEGRENIMRQREHARPCQVRPRIAKPLAGSLQDERHVQANHRHRIGPVPGWNRRRVRWKATGGDALLNVLEEPPGKIQRRPIAAHARKLRETHHDKTIRVNARRRSVTRHGLLHLPVLGQQEPTSSVIEPGVGGQKPRRLFRLREKWVRVSRQQAAARRVRQPRPQPDKAALRPGELVAAEEPRAGIVPAGKNPAELAVDRAPPERHDRLRQRGPNLRLADCGQGRPFRGRWVAEWKRRRFLVHK